MDFPDPFRGAIQGGKRPHRAAQILALDEADHAAAIKARHQHCFDAAA